MNSQSDHSVSCSHNICLSSTSLLVCLSNKYKHSYNVWYLTSCYSHFHIFLLTLYSLSQYWNLVSFHVLSKGILWFLINFITENSTLSFDTKHRNCQVLFIIRICIVFHPSSEIYELIIMYLYSIGFMLFLFLVSSLSFVILCSVYLLKCHHCCYYSIQLNSLFINLYSYYYLSLSSFLLIIFLNLIFVITLILSSSIISIYNHQTTSSHYLIHLSLFKYGFYIIHPHSTTTTTSTTIVWSIDWTILDLLDWWPINRYH